MRVLVVGGFPLPLALAPRVSCAARLPGRYSVDGSLAVSPASAPCPVELRVQRFPGGRLAVHAVGVAETVPVPADALEALLSGQPAPPGVRAEYGDGWVEAGYGGAWVRAAAGWGASGAVFAEGCSLAAGPGWVPGLLGSVEAYGPPGDLWELSRRLSLLEAPGGSVPGSRWAARRAVLPFGSRRRLLGVVGGRGGFSYGPGGSPGSWELLAGLSEAAAEAEAWVLPGPDGLVDVYVGPRAATPPPPAPLPLLAALLETGDPGEAARLAWSSSSPHRPGRVDASGPGLRVRVAEVAPGPGLPLLRLEGSLPPAPLRLLLPAYSGYSVEVEWGPGAGDLLAALARAANEYWTRRPSRRRTPPWRLPSWWYPRG